MDAHEKHEKSFEQVLKEISSYPGDTIPVPFLAAEINLNPGTLNARIKRKHIKVYIKGRTNYIPKEEARTLACLNEPAIRNWPCIQELSSKYHVAYQTLSYWREKEELRGQHDLTRRLRINPSDEEKIPSMVQAAHAPNVIEINGNKFYSLTKAARDAALFVLDENNPKFKEIYKKSYYKFHARLHKGKVEYTLKNFHVYLPEKEYLRMINPDPQYKKPTRKYKSPKPKKNASMSNVKKPIKIPAPPAKIICNPDYDFPELPPVEIAHSNPVQEADKKTDYIDYDPFSPPPFSQCEKGRRINYMGSIGIIAEVCDSDPYRPLIKVRFLGARPEGLESLLLITKSKFALAV